MAGPMSSPTQVHVRALPAATPQQALAIKAAAQLPTALLSAEGAALTAAARPQQVKPGKERWMVKTGQDSEVDRVGAVVVDTTVEELVAMVRPQDMQPPTQEFSKYEDTRVQSVETTIWRIHAKVTFFKFEADGDFHLVLQGDSGMTMVGEVPMPQKAFLGDSPWFDDITQARTAAQTGLSNVPATPYVKSAGMWMPMAVAGDGGLTRAAGPQTLGQFLAQTTGASLTAAAAPGAAAPGAAAPLQVFAAAIAPKSATVTGVGFFDRVHGQTGVAATGIELHPILDLAWA